MWSNYKKVYVFRDCFEAEQIEGEIKQINDMLEKQVCLLGAGALLVSIPVKEIRAYKSEDTGELELSFTNGKEEIIFISTFDYKEIQLCFEFEENLETGAILLHGCGLKTFKEYQK